jgi:hypothetical protein
MKTVRVEEPKSKLLQLWQSKTYKVNFDRPAHGTGNSQPQTTRNVDDIRPSVENFVTLVAEELQTSPKRTRCLKLQSFKLNSRQQSWGNGPKVDTVSPIHAVLPPQSRNGRPPLTQISSTEFSESWRSLPVVEDLAPPKKDLPIYLNGQYIRACADFGAAGNVVDVKGARKLRLKVVLDSSCVSFELPTFGRAIKPIGRATVDCQFPREPDTRAQQEFFVFENFVSPVLWDVPSYERLGPSTATHIASPSGLWKCTMYPSLPFYLAKKKHLSFGWTAKSCPRRQVPISNSGSTIPCVVFLASLLLFRRSCELITPETGQWNSGL